MTAPKKYYWLGSEKPSSQDTFFIEALSDELWAQGSEDHWDTCWYTGMPNQAVFDQLQSHQTINHIPGNNALTIKSHLYQTLVNARKRVAGTDQEQHFNFFPETFSMPEDYFAFLQTANQEPQQLWIKKPKNLSRGRGIDMVRHASTVPIDDEWIIQRYLSNPHLCQGRKYVLRCYVLITSVEPLRFYWYQDGFAKLASEPYSAEDLHNLYRHLTNPDINEKNEDAESAVTFISFKKYGQWLRSEGHDDKYFFEQLKNMIRTTVIAARESMRSRVNTMSGDSGGCYELIGLDCMVDDNIKPWIIECNLSPSLSTYADPKAGADDEVIAKRDMVRDLVNLIGLNDPNPTILAPLEKAQQEDQHKGLFERLFPDPTSPENIGLFPVPRYADIVASGLHEQTRNMVPTLTRNDAHNYTFSDSVALFSLTTNKAVEQCLAPNDIATWIWLQHSEGLTPDKIIEELQQTLPYPNDTSPESHHQAIATQVWDVLADWSNSNFFNRQQQNTSTPTVPLLASPKTAYLSLSTTTVHIYFFCDTAKKYLEHVCLPEQPSSNHNLQVDIIPSYKGYCIICNRTKVINNLKLSELLPILYQLLLDKITTEKEAVFIEGSLLKSHKNITFVVTQPSEWFDGVAYSHIQNTATQLISQGIIILPNGDIQTLELPIKLSLNSETSLPDNNQTTKPLIAEKNNTSFEYKKIINNKDHNKVSVDKIVFLIEDDRDDFKKSHQLQYLYKNSGKCSLEQIQIIANWLNTIEAAQTIMTNKEKNIEDLRRELTSS